MVLSVRRETGGRGGQTGTTVTGLGFEDAQLRAMAALLKRRCGTGGTVKEGIIEIQGDRVDLLLRELEAQGYRVKKSGG